MVQINGDVTETNNITVTQTATTGNALTISRDLAAGSTSAPVVTINNANSGDDQYSLEVTSYALQNTAQFLNADITGTYHCIWAGSTGSTMNETPVFLQQPATLNSKTDSFVPERPILNLNRATSGSRSPAIRFGNNATAPNGGYLYGNNSSLLCQLSITTEGDTAAGGWRTVTDINNNAAMILTGYWIWVDGSGKLRIKSSVPSSDTDGTIVGTQS